MPGMNGRDLAEKLRAHRPSAKVLFTSGYDEDVVARGGTLDTGRYLAKPFGTEVLTSTVRKLLDESSDDAHS